MGTLELAQYQEALPVRLIETPRKDFVWCKLDDTLGALRARNADDSFDHLPVRDGEGHVIGVLNIAALGARPDTDRVRDSYELIGESVLIGADVSILQFLLDADRRPFRFLVRSDGISGLVSLSDIQRLPVRAALFAIVTQFEIAMARLIDARFPRDEWLDHLTPCRRQRVEQEREKASKGHNQVARLLYTQFADKTGLLRRIAQERGNDRNRDNFDGEFGQLEELRNRVAHANALGITREDAIGIINRVRTIQAWIVWIERTCHDIGTENK